MSSIDWIVLFGTLFAIVAYGVWKTKSNNSMESYLKGSDQTKWWAIGLSIMATQASAITFLSTPGQAYTDGMRFIQFYFGLPIAMIIISIFFLPLYYKAKVYTAYEFLESRFDVKTRMLAAFIFLIQRGLAAGITIYAPAIILSALLGWPLQLTTLIIGALVIVYTVSGGTEAVTQTQKQQMAVMMGGMVVAGVLVVKALPESVGLTDALHVAGKMGKLNVVNFEFDLNDRYNFWSGITGAVFLFMSYFGTDQSQVQRYLSGKTLKESRMGLMMNGLLKVPMQFVILLIGALVFVYYQYNQPPIFFNEAVRQEVLLNEEYGEDFQAYEQEYADLFTEKLDLVKELNAAVTDGSPTLIETTKHELNRLQGDSDTIRARAKDLIAEALPNRETNDKDYIFMNFVMNTMPVGIVGLLFAVIFSAAMSSTSSELNALGSTTLIDFYKRRIKPNESDQHYVKYSKLFTLLWGVIAIIFASTLSLFENLIQAVNLIGSLFYPIILGIFVVAFFFKRVGSSAVFIAAIISQAVVILVHYLNTIGQAGPLKMGFLWYNAFGCLLVVLIGLLLNTFIKPKEQVA
ncbi:sodium:solute symporter [Roseivirga pacifica]|uniref:sodium:solute symporter n=1 Tax=Roseivirga pacifica TaxID=1267423 RepID=UPI002095A8AC|nr:sodium:solute symporter [Roseivirga pacifica]MCO6360798.1 sodium:solute symporter [Roseivirga pacifica]MCO6368687.1 sodium:solute symporter [Roseivirga pacifica]MCO6376889.1 sodium:solute symporter [Roseivirga pacifica]MCO6377833.1 sodium:solute symporter [Roseivirga pacifica]